MTIVEEIKKLKEEKDAVILAHYYVRPEVQEIADYIGDSFYLSKVATKLKEQTISFCGVSFMGESAKILNPKKTVLMPDMNADCPMAHMAEIETIKNMAFAINDIMIEFFKKMNINLIDFKLEFGKVADGSIVLADEISPDTCRLWDAKTHEKLDKDRFRRDLGGVEDAYAEIMKRLLDHDAQ